MKTLIPILLLSLTAFVSCSDDDMSEPAKNEGRIAGTVKLYDEFGQELPSHSGMKVSTQNGMEATTNDTGWFQIGDLPAGNYLLSYEMPGFGTYKRFNINMTNANSVVTLNGTDHLGQQSTTLVTNLTSSYEPNDSTYTFTCTLAPAPDATHPRSVRLFFGKTAGVNFDDYTYTPPNTWVATTATGTITAFPLQTLLTNGFSSGETVYLMAYGESIRTNTYTEPVSGKKFFPNLNSASPSNTATFLLP